MKKNPNTLNYPILTVRKEEFFFGNFMDIEIPDFFMNIILFFELVKLDRKSLK